MFRIVFLYFLLIFGIISTPAQNSPETLQLLDRSHRSVYENPDITIQILQNIDSSNEPEFIKLRLQHILAMAYSLKGDYVTSINQSLKQDFQNIKKDGISYFYIKFVLAHQYQSLGIYNQAVRISENLVEESKNLQEGVFSENLLAEIYSLNAGYLATQGRYKEAYLKLDQSDEIMKNTNEAHCFFLENKIFRYQIYLAENQIERAESSALEMQKQLKKNPEYVYLTAYNLNMLGRISFLKKDYKASMDYLTKALKEIENVDFEPLKLKIYNDMSKVFLVERNEKDYHLYNGYYKKGTEKLMSNKKEAVRNLLKLNDLYENKRLEIAQYSQKRNLTITVVTCFLAIAALFLVSIFERRKKETLQKQIDFYTQQQEYIKKIKNLEDKQNNNTVAVKADSENVKKTPFISKEKEQDLLSKLDEFEKSGKFLSKEMSLAVLAGQLETNTKYLSEVINKYKEKNFNNYINELRINHIAYLLKTEPAYLNYKVSYLAEVSGFSSHSSFTTVFKSITGISPNVYIQQIQK